jgi:hypothetical protein
VLTSSTKKIIEEKRKIIAPHATDGAGGSITTRNESTAAADRIPMRYKKYEVEETEERESSMRKRAVMKSTCCLTLRKESSPRFLTLKTSPLQQKQRKIKGIWGLMRGL